MARPRATTPTQATVANIAGVSVPTVSKALRGDPSISPSTRSHVRSVAQDLGYPIRVEAEDVAPVRSRVTALFDTVNNAYASNLLEGMIATAAHLNLAMQVDHLGHAASCNDASETAVMKVFDRVLPNTDGLILVTMTANQRMLEACHAREIPVLIIDPAVTPPPGLVTLAATNWRGAKEATEYLLSLGHRRIGVAAGPETSVPTVDRIAGYRSALSEAGIAFDPSLVIHGAYRYDAGVATARALLTLPDPPTAIFALSDLLAIGVLSEARTQKLEVPQDLSIVGFDDTQLAVLARPSLTCIHQPLTEMGVEAIQLMRRAIDAKKVPGLPVELRTTLMIRDSTGRPRH